MGKRKEVTQKDRVLKYMYDTGSITSLDAIREFGITRLAAVIKNLRDLGYNIETHTETSKNRYSEPVHYARYRFKEEKAG